MATTWNKQFDPWLKSSGNLNLATLLLHLNLSVCEDSPLQDQVPHLTYLCLFRILWSWHKVVLKKCYWANGGKIVIFINKASLVKWIKEESTNDYCPILMGHLMSPFFLMLFYLDSQVEIYNTTSHIYVLRQVGGGSSFNQMQATLNYSNICFWLHLTGSRCILCLTPVLSGLPTEMCTQKNPNGRHPSQPLPCTWPFLQWTDKQDSKVGAT